MTDKTHMQIFLIYDMDDEKIISARGTKYLAIEAARRLATELLGHTIIVFAPDEAFKAAPVVSKVYLKWPAEPDPVQPPSPHTEAL